MKKIKISIPLSTANLACGFDTFALALSLCNEYVFEVSEKDELKGFLDKYNNSNNMCLSAFKETFSILNKDAMNVRITLNQHIPNCGGLGSSANVIIAGVSAAYYFINGRIDKDEILKIACKIEGHPDNVLAEVFGGLTSAIKFEDDIKYFKYDVSEELRFTLLIPPFSLNTKEMRACLPKEVSMKDAVFNISRASNLVYALKMGKIEDLVYLMDDKLHQQYRIDKIKGAKEVQEYASKNNIAFAISGSGASLLLVSKNEIKDNFNGFEKIELKVNNEGLILYEEN